MLRGDQIDLAIEVPCFDEYVVDIFYCVIGVHCLHIGCCWGTVDERDR